MQFERPITCGKKVTAKVKVFQKQVKLQGQKFQYHVKDLVTRNTHVQYKSTYDRPRLKFLFTHKPTGHQAITVAPWTFVSAC